MKNFKNWSILILMALTMQLISSCGGDDETASTRDKLIGIWKTTMSSRYWKCIELKADGSIIMTYVKDNGEVWAKKNQGGKYYWNYSEKDQTIFMYSDDNYFSYTYKVFMADDGNVWTGHTLDSSSESYSFTRLKGPVHYEENQ